MDTLPIHHEAGRGCLSPAAQFSSPQGKADWADLGLSIAAAKEQAYRMYVALIKYFKLGLQ